MRVLGSAMPVPRPAVTTPRAELRPVPDVGGGQRAGSDRRQPLEPVAVRPRLLSSRCPQTANSGQGEDRDRQGRFRPEAGGKPWAGRTLRGRRRPLPSSSAAMDAASVWKDGYVTV